MQTKFVINLNSITKLYSFVNKITRVDCDVDARYGRQLVDAKSLLGVISLSIHPMEITINNYNEEQLALFNEICKEFEVEE